VRDEEITALQPWTFFSVFVSSQRLNCKYSSPIPSEAYNYLKRICRFLKAAASFRSGEADPCYKIQIRGRRSYMKLTIFHMHSCINFDMPMFNAVVYHLIQHKGCHFYTAD
jgi:hypothetical protein